MMEISIPTMANSRLTTFNTLALQYQDEAYTLAYYLMGDETRAAEATQTAFTRLYQRAGLRLDQFRLEVLQWVIATCAQAGTLLARTKPQDDLCQKLLTLHRDQRVALVLVDMLGLGYEEAAQVLGCSKKQFSKQLAQARLDLRNMV